MAITKTDGTTAIRRGPAPEFVTIYDEVGNAFEKFPIDARECVGTGRFSYRKPEAAADETETAPQVEASVVEPKKRGRKSKGDS